MIRFPNASPVIPDGHNGRCDTQWTVLRLTILNDIIGSLLVNYSNILGVFLNDLLSQRNAGGTRWTQWTLYYCLDTFAAEWCARGRQLISRLLIYENVT